VSNVAVWVSRGDIMVPEDARNTTADTDTEGDGVGVGEGGVGVLDAVAVPVDVKLVVELSERLGVAVADMVLVPGGTQGQNRGTGEGPGVGWAYRPGGPGRGC
jgi:hypothetical protein